MALEGFETVVRPGLKILARRGLADDLLAATDHGTTGAARGRVRFARVGDERAAIRHYFRGGLLGRFVRDLYVDPGRAVREVELYERARGMGVPTLEPLGAVARRAGVFWRLDLVTRAVDGAKDLGALYEEGLARASPRRRAALLGAAARAVRALHEAGIEHADLNLKNLLLVEAEGLAPRALVIDLDRAREQAAPLASPRRTENLLRLYRSARKLARARGEAVSTGDVLRFARAYVGEDDGALREFAGAFARYGLRLFAHRVFWKTA